MRFQSSRQLHDMFQDHIKKGRDCIYMCHDFRHCEYMIEMMLTMYRHNSFSWPNRMIFYDKARVKFRSTGDRPDQVLCGPPSFVVLDHAALKKLSTVKRVEWKSHVNHNNERILGNVS